MLKKVIFILIFTVTLFANVNQKLDISRFPKDCNIMIEIFESHSEDSKLYSITIDSNTGELPPIEPGLFVDIYIDGERVFTKSLLSDFLEDSSSRDFESSDLSPMETEEIGLTIHGEDNTSFQGGAIFGASMGIEPSGMVDIRGDELRIWDGIADVDYAINEGDLYVENNAEIDGILYLSASSEINIDGTTGSVDEVLGIGGSGNLAWLDIGSVGGSEQSLSEVLDVGHIANDGQQINIDKIQARDADGLMLAEDGSDGVFIEDGGNVGIGTTTPESSAKLDVNSTTAGFLPPRMTTAQRDAISSPVDGLMIYNISNSCLQIFSNTIWNNIWCYHCWPEISSHPANESICDGEDVTFAVVADGSELAYQWQENDGSGWSDILESPPYSNVTTSLLSISPANISMDGYEYRCYITGTCTPDAVSDAAVLTVNSLSIAASSIDASETVICTGSSVTLNVSGGTLGSGANWQWYSGSCGGTSIGSGTTISPSPISTTSYFVRAEGYCNTTSCASITIDVTSSTEIGEEYYTSPGTYTFTVPAEVTSICVAAVGGGGGGCGHLGGMGGDPDAVPGDPGGNSSFGAIITAYGGEGGGRQYDPAANGGEFDGPYGFYGGNGGTLYGGGGGGAATFTSNGGDGTDGSPTTASDGGNGGDSGGSGGIGDYGDGGSGGGIYLTGTPNTGQNGTTTSAGNYGGGGGGSSVNAGGGGGGAGGGIVWQNDIAVTPGDTYTVIVGEGGSSGASYATDGQNGAVRIIWQTVCSDVPSYPDNAD